MAENPMLIMKDHFFDSLGRSDLKSGGDHRHDYMKPEEKKIIQDEMKKIMMFCDGREKKVKYNINIRRVWENLTDVSIEEFLKRNKKNYKLKYSYRF